MTLTLTRLAQIGRLLTAVDSGGLHRTAWDALRPLKEQRANAEAVSTEEALLALFLVRLMADARGGPGPSPPS
jgi:YD repeat-containing protein